MKKIRSNFSEDRFGRECQDNKIPDLKSEINSENMDSQKRHISTELADICNICHKFTWNIFTHIKNSHPFVYKKMMEKFI